MRTVFKIFLVSLFLLISTSFSVKYDSQIYVPWKVSGSGYWTNAKGYSVYNDFDYMVSKSTYPDQYGYYSYDFWFYSQSYYWDGYKANYASTNVRDISIYLNDGYGLKLMSYDNSMIGITFFDNYSPTKLRVKAKSYNPIILIKWNFMSAM